MKKYFLLLLTVVLLTGCAFKNKVTSLEKEMKNLSAEEIAEKRLLELKKEFKHKSKVNNLIFSGDLFLEDISREKNHLTIILRLDIDKVYIHNKRQIKELIKEHMKDQKKKFMDIFCSTNALLRASINSGVNLNVIVKNDDNVYSSNITKKVCENLDSYMLE